MSAIRIDTLPVLENLEDRDLVNFQRLVDGVWTDYHTDAATLQGAIRTFSLFVDFASPPPQPEDYIVYTPAADELVVPICAWAIADDPGDGAWSYLIYDENFGTGALAGGDYVFINGKYAAPAAESGGNFTGMDTPLTISYGQSSPPPTTTVTIFVQYAVVPKI